MPEPYYDQRQYWFKIDNYASSDPKYTAGKAFFCEGCRGMQSPEAFRQANFSSRRKRLSSDMHRVRAYCCTQSSELRGQLSAIDRFSKIRPRISYIYAYDTTLQFKNPSDDMVAPVAYTEYGKTISHYGGLRIAPHHAIE